MAFIVSPVVVDIVRNDLEVECRVWVRRPRITVPVSCSISNHCASEGNSPQSWVELCLQVVLVDLPRKIRDVDAGVTLATHEK